MPAPRCSLPRLAVHSQKTLITTPLQEFKGIKVTRVLDPICMLLNIYCLGDRGELFLDDSGLLIPVHGIIISDSVEIGVLESIFWDPRLAEGLEFMSLGSWADVHWDPGSIEGLQYLGFPNFAMTYPHGLPIEGLQKFWDPCLIDDSKSMEFISSPESVSYTCADGMVSLQPRPPWLMCDVLVKKWVQQSKRVSAEHWQQKCGGTDRIAPAVKWIFVIAYTICMKSECLDNVLEIVLLNAESLLQRDPGVSSEAGHWWLFLPEDVTLHEQFSQCMCVIIPIQVYHVPIQVDTTNSYSVVTIAGKCCTSSLLSKSLSIQIAHGDLVVSNSQLLHAPDWVALLLIAVTNRLNILDSALIYSSHAVVLQGILSVRQWNANSHSQEVSRQWSLLLSEAIMLIVKYPKYMRRRNHMQGHFLPILVDSGSSYSFIAVTVAEKLPRASKYSQLLHVTWEIFSGVSKYSFLISSRHPVMHFVFMVCTSPCMSKILSSERFCLLLPTVVFHIVSFIAGYWIFKLLQWRQEEPVCRTNSVGTGLQNSTLAGLLDEEYGVGNRKCAKPNDGQADRQPIDDILQWHNAIHKELHDIAEETRRMHQSANFSDILLFNGRLQYVADVCIFHSIAEDQVVFPSVESELVPVLTQGIEKQKYLIHLKKFIQFWQYIELHIFLCLCTYARLSMADWREYSILLMMVIMPISLLSSGPWLMLHYFILLLQPAIWRCSTGLSFFLQLVVVLLMANQKNLSQPADKRLHTTWNKEFFLRCTAPLEVQVPHLCSSIQHALLYCVCSIVFVEGLEVVHYMVFVDWMLPIIHSCEFLLKCDEVAPGTIYNIKVMRVELQLKHEHLSSFKQVLDLL